MGQLSWPLLGLIALLILLLIAAIVNQFSGGQDDSQNASVLEQRVHAVSTMRSPQMDDAEDGMISAVTGQVRSVIASPTTTKDS